MEMMEKLKFTGVALGILILLCASPGAGLFSAGAVSAAPDGELCQECQLYDPEPQREYPIMRPSGETRRGWIERYNRAPKAHMSDKIKRELDRSPEGSQSLLDHLEYTPSQRNQGSCGNCWAWAGTGVMEIALDVQQGVYERLSVQYINSCESIIGKTCCDGGWLYHVADFYTETGMAIPWSNTNASWQDGDASCDTACGSISTTPNYVITSITDQTISTQGIGQSTAISNIKNVLDQNKAVWFGFFLADDSDWDNFRNFWNNQSESTIWDPDSTCGHTYDPVTGGGHAVLCVGYNDDDPTPANQYWIMLNSWGTAGGGRPNGLFCVDMNMNYDCWHTGASGGYAFYWQTLDITYEAVGGGTTLDRQVGASTDDCLKGYNGSTWGFGKTGDYLEAGYCSSTKYRRGSGLRFTNITIPQGATITEAHLTLRCNYSTSTSTVRTKIRGEDADDATMFSDLANYDARPRTTAFINWDSIPAWSSGNDYNSPDIETIIQEIVNRGGWQSGNDLVIFWDDHDDRSTHSNSARKVWTSYDSSPSNAPKLHIEYSGEAPPIVAPTVTNSTGASDITSTSARLNGEVTSTGGENPTIHIYWGDNDGGTTSGNWANSVPLATKGVESFYTDITSLDPSTTYYYRCYASNSGGNDWADSSETFTATAGELTLDRQVGASNHDCTVSHSGSSWGFGNSGSYLEVGYCSSTKYRRGCGLRFTNITIPKGATITEAHLTFRCNYSTSVNYAKCRIRAEKSANPSAPSNVTDYFDRTRTDANVNWDNIPPWSSGHDYNSSDIKAVIQEIVNQASWENGNAILIFWDDHDDRSTHSNNARKAASSYDYSTSYAPKLHIEYSSQPPEPPNAPTPVSPGTSITFKWNPSATATKYHLQVNTLTNFTGTDMFNAELGNVTSQEVTGLSLGITYYWRVKAGNDGGWSDWSSVRSVIANEVP